MPPRRLHPKPLQQPHPPLWVASTSPDSHVLAGELGLGLLSFTIGVSPEDLAERLKLFRDAQTRAQPIGKFVNPRAATFTMVHCAETDEQAFAEAAESFEWYVRTALWHIGTVAEWQEGKPLGTYDYAEVAQGPRPVAAHVRLPAVVGRVHRRRARSAASRSRAATTRPTAICCSACSIRTRSRTRR